MSTESQQQIADGTAEAFSEWLDVSLEPEQTAKLSAFILSAIERATEEIYAKSEEPRCDFVSHMQSQHTNAEVRELLVEALELAWDGLDEAWCEYYPRKFKQIATALTKVKEGK